MAESLLPQPDTPVQMKVFQGGGSSGGGGTQLASSSQTNKDMKEQLKKDATPQVAKNQQTNVVNQTQTAQASPRVDDRPIWQQKATV